MTELFPSRRPRFNHVAMSMPAAELGPEGRSSIVSFYGDVFGWTELPTMTVDGQRLVLSANTYEQFVFLVAEDVPMQCPRLDHFGLSVGNVDELHAAHARAADRGADDPAVDLIAPSIDDHDVVKIHSFYVGYRLPMMIEVQYWEFADQALADAVTASGA